MNRLGDKAVWIMTLIVFVWIGLDAVNFYFEQKQSVAVEKLEKVVLGCLNQGAMIIDGVAHECRPVSYGVKL